MGKGPENVNRTPRGACRCATRGMCLSCFVSAAAWMAVWPCARARMPRGVSACLCAFECLRVLCVHVSVSKEYVCLRGRVSVACVQAGPRASRHAQHSDSAGLQVAGPLLRSRASRTLGLAAALWPGAGEGSKVGGGSGPEGRLRAQGEGMGHLRSLHKGWGEYVGERTGARVFVLPRPPGWTCS